MKKNLLILLTALLLSCSLIGCGETEETVQVNVENPEDLHNTKFGIGALVYIGNKLYYDSTTRIVYFWNGACCGVDFSTTPSPYYAPNGLPYKYNPETNTFEEINLKELYGEN